jgi:hypothetical protein
MKHELLPLVWNDPFDGVSLWANSFAWARRTHSPDLRQPMVHDWRLCLRPSSTPSAIHPTPTGENAPSLNLFAQDESGIGILEERKENRVGMPP